VQNMIYLTKIYAARGGLWGFAVWDQQIL